MMHTVDESQDKVKMRNIEKNTGPQSRDGARKAQAQLELKLAKGGRGYRKSFFPYLHSKRKTRKMWACS